jgi:hypothetical protein
LELVDQDAIIQYVMDTFTGVEVIRPTGGPGAVDTFFFYDPQHNLNPKRRFPLATIVTKDCGDFDGASNLSRRGVLGSTSALAGTPFVLTSAIYPVRSCRRTIAAAE